MALDTVHPLYSEYKDDWVTMRDLYKGERAIKAKGETYLPSTKGMKLDGMTHSTDPGREAYDAYKLRAVFHDYVKDAVESFIGLMHQKPPNIKLPASMEPMREKCTLYGESMELLLRRMNEEQLVTGRVGIMLDLPTTVDPSNPMPQIAMYVAESIRNWNDGESEEGETRLNLVVLDESGYVCDSDFSWRYRTKYRVLLLGDVEKAEAEDSGAIYRQGVFGTDSASSDFNEAGMMEPMIRGSTLQRVPFVFVNSKDIIARPDEPPLMGLGRLALAIYRGEADYRQNLFMQGQDTLVLIGATRRSADASQQSGEPLRTGAGSMIEVDQGGDAKYIGVESSGLSEQREALQNDQAQAEAKSGRLTNGNGNMTESGEALQTRIAAQTATLNQIALTAAGALERLLKIAAQWIGADPNEVKVDPNLDFTNQKMTGKDMVDIMSAKNMGLPLSRKSIHSLLVDRGVTKLDFVTEQEEIDEEEPAGLRRPVGTQAGGNPDILPATPRGSNNE